MQRNGTFRSSRRTRLALHSGWFNYQFKRLRVCKHLTLLFFWSTCDDETETWCWAGREWTYLQFGQDGDDLESMTRRWQFKQAKATMLLVLLLLLVLPDDDELLIILVSLMNEFEPMNRSLEWADESGEMLSSRSSLWLLRWRLSWSLGISQLFLNVLLFR